MYIQEATKKALEAGGYITRESWGERFAVYIEPTDTPLCCLVHSLKIKEGPRPRWNPQAEDLIADDWYVLP